MKIQALLGRHRGPVIKRCDAPGSRSPLVSVWLEQGYGKRDFSLTLRENEENSPKKKMPMTFGADRSLCSSSSRTQDPLLWENRAQGKSLAPNNNGRAGGQTAAWVSPPAAARSRQILKTTASRWTLMVGAHVSERNGRMYVLPASFNVPNAKYLGRRKSMAR